jgi:hypothetical protein
MKTEELNPNELIAIYLGLDRHPNNQRAYWIEDQDCYLTFDNLQFHHSWNQLMPACRKFLTQVKGIHFGNHSIYTWANAQRGLIERAMWNYVYSEGSTEDVRNALSEGIKWYNQQLQ